MRVMDPESLGILVANFELPDYLRFDAASSVDLYLLRFACCLINVCSIRGIWSLTFAILLTLLRFFLGALADVLLGPL